MKSGLKTDQKKLLCRKENVLQQDGAPAHKSKVAQEFCLINFANFIPSHVWPGNSPNLNVIEYVWGKIQEHVFILPMPTDRVELITCVQ